MANHDQEPWKMPLPDYIGFLYEKRFGRTRPEVVKSIEERLRETQQKKEARRQQKAQRKSEGQQGEQRKVGAIAWYTPEQWARLKEISDDRERLDDTYEEWLQHAEELQVELEAKGLYVLRMLVDVEEVRRWCQEMQIPFNTSSRAKYVVAHAAEEYARRQGAAAAEPPPPPPEDAQT